MSHPEGQSRMRTTLPSISLKSLRVYGGGANVRLVPLRFGQALVVEVPEDPFAFTEVPRRPLRESVLCAPGMVGLLNSNTSKCLPSPLVVHLTRVSCGEAGQPTSSAAPHSRARGLMAVLTGTKRSRSGTGLEASMWMWCSSASSPWCCWPLS